MPVLVPGILYEQLVVTVANNDTDINAEIVAQAADEYILSLMVLSGSNMVLLFARQIPDET